MSTRAERVDRGMETFGAPGALLVLLVAYSIWLGVDTSWDLRNYHLYNPFALLHKAPGTDLAAGQLQTWFSPVFDLLPHALRSVFADRPTLLTLAMTMPSAVATVLVFRLGLLLVPPTAKAHALAARWTVVSIATFYGLTGAGGLTTTGSTMSEMPSGCFVLGALLLLVARLPDQPRSARAEIVANLLGGIAVGIKLTAGPLVVALLVARLVAGDEAWRGKLRIAALFGVAVIVAFVLTGGPWFLYTYLQTGSPIFPFFNDVFRSPLYPAIAMHDERFKPHGVLQTLFYPAYWAFESTTVVSDVALRDPRMLVNVAAALAVFSLFVRDRLVGRRAVDDHHARRNLLVAVFVVIGFALWEKEFSILRYLVPLEVVGGFAAIALLRRCGMRSDARATAALCAVTAAITAFTVYPKWGRTTLQVPVYRTVLPPLGPDDMVLLLQGEPLSFVATFADPAVRFVGVQNNFVVPGSSAGIAVAVEDAVAGHRGRLWGLEVERKAERSEAALAYHALHRTDRCQPVPTNLQSTPIRLCELARGRP